MKLNPPKKVTFWISIFAFVVGAALAVVPVPVLSVIGFIVALLAYLLLVLGLVVKGL